MFEFFFPIDEYDDSNKNSLKDFHNSFPDLLESVKSIHNANENLELFVGEQDDNLFYLLEMFVGLADKKELSRLINLLSDFYEPIIEKLDNLFQQEQDFDPSEFEEHCSDFIKNELNIIDE